MSSQPETVLGLYVGGQYGMDHPCWAARMQAGIDASLCIMMGIPQEVAIEQTVRRLRRGFGDDIPYELIAIPVMLAYLRHLAVD